MAEGVAAIGGAPELNSAQRGHFRFVSVVEEEGQKRPRQTIDRKERGRGRPKRGHPDHRLRRTSEIRRLRESIPKSCSFL